MRRGRRWRDGIAVMHDGGEDDVDDDDDTDDNDNDDDDEN